MIAAKTSKSGWSTYVRTYVRVRHKFNAYNSFLEPKLESYIVICTMNQINQDTTKDRAYVSVAPLDGAAPMQSLNGSY